jgi:hypothetical protein
MVAPRGLRELRGAVLSTGHHLFATEDSGQE